MCASCGRRIPIEVVKEKHPARRALALGAVMVPLLRYVSIANSGR